MILFKKKFHLVIVCTANRTRSAYFAEYLRHYLTQYGPGVLKRLKIMSAGTQAIPGGRSNDVVAMIARNNGFNLRKHAARKITSGMIRRADLVLVMEQVHKDDILDKFPKAKDKVFRLMEYGLQGDEPPDSLDVPDPTGKNADDFKAFIDVAHEEADRLVQELLNLGVI